jgi:hypothetical protein
VLPKREFGLSSFATTRPLLEQVLLERVMMLGSVYRAGFAAMRVLVERQPAPSAVSLASAPSPVTKRRVAG